MKQPRDYSAGDKPAHIPSDDDALKPRDGMKSVSVEVGGKRETIFIPSAYKLLHAHELLAIGQNAERLANELRTAHAVHAQQLKEMELTFAKTISRMEKHIAAKRDQTNMALAWARQAEAAMTFKWKWVWATLRGRAVRLHEMARESEVRITNAAAQQDAGSH